LESPTWPLSNSLENTIKIRGYEANRSVATPSKLQQSVMCVGGAFATPLGLQDLRELLSDGDSLSRKAPLQQIQRSIILTAVIGILLNG
jgi:hypothetical protein